MVICVASANDIPRSALQRLAPHAALLTKTRYVDDLLKVPELVGVVEELDAHCIRQGVVGFHFTRALRASIEKDGLVIKTGAERRKAFITDFGRHFTQEQIQRINEAWDGYFPGQQDNSRNGRVCFALTEVALTDGGAKPLLQHFGGEAIYMPLTQHPDLVQVLRGLGEPLVVRCALDPTRSKAYYEHPWGTVWLSSYHRSLNPDAHQLDQDVSVLYSIPASDIISITNADTGL